MTTNQNRQAEIEQDLTEFRSQFIKELAEEIAEQVVFLTQAEDKKDVYERTIRSLLYSRLPPGTLVLYRTKKYSQ